MRIQALLDMSEDEYERLDPQKQREIDSIRLDRCKEKRKELAFKSGISLCCVT